MRRNSLTFIDEFLSAMAVNKDMTVDKKQFEMLPEILQATLEDTLNE